MTEAKKTIPLSRIQKLISDRMLESKRTQPCCYLSCQADVDKISKIRRPMSKELGVRISLNDFFLRAMAVAIEKYPLFAASLNGDTLEISETINVGLAVAAPSGLVVPAIREANKKSLVEIAAAGADIIERARADKLSLDDVEGVCMSLSALGMFGVQSFLAIPSPGQCGILSIGKIIDTPIVIDGEIEIRKTVNLCLAADGRIVDGFYAGKFLDEIKSLLANPDRLN